MRKVQIKSINILFIFLSIPVLIIIVCLTNTSILSTIKNIYADMETETTSYEDATLNGIYTETRTGFLMSKLYVSKGETVEILKEVESIEDARKFIEQSEATDKKNKVYAPNAYDIVDEYHHTILIECPICRKRRARNEMKFTHDCHGIPFRLVCYDYCYQDAMKKGYDGKYYTEADECLDYDY